MCVDDVLLSLSLCIVNTHVCVCATSFIVFWPPQSTNNTRTNSHTTQQGAFLVPADYGTGTAALVESPHANIFMSMFYIVSDTTTSELSFWHCRLWIWAVVHCVVLIVNVDGGALRR